MDDEEIMDFLGKQLTEAETKENNNFTKINDNIMKLNENIDKLSNSIIANGKDMIEALLNMSRNFMNK